MDCPASDRPLRIAFVYSRLPFPMMRGDQLTVSHLLGFLAARGHAVDFYTLDMQGAVSADQRTWLDASCRSVRIYRQGKAAIVSGLVQGLFRREPAQVALFRNARLAHDLRAATRAGTYDLIYCYYMRSAHAVPFDLTREAPGAMPGAPVSFLAMQLSQSLNSRRICENERNWLKRAFYKVETALCERFEARIWQRFTRSVLIGDADVAAVRGVCAKQKQREIDNWIYGAHGTDIAHYRPALPAEVIEDRVVFSGSMLYQPNIQAVQWFVDRCWPTTRAARPDATLIIQGRDPVPAIQALDGRNGIVVTGTVPDVSLYIRSAAVCINPMLAAGGMQNKLIEYMACGKAVVATSVANEGIGAPEGTLRIADDADGFARAVIDLCERPEAAAALGLAARRYVEAYWSWEHHFLLLEEAFYEALGIPVPDRAIAQGRAA